MKTKIDKEAIIIEYLSGGTSYRQLAKKYGCTRSTLNEWVMTYEGRGKNAKRKKKRHLSAKELGSDVKQLQQALRQAQLRNQVLETVLDIGKDRYGIDLLKKTGTKQS
jgi:transposase-like protein